MQFSYSGLRYALAAAAVALALPASAQIVDHQAEPSSEAYREVPSVAAPTGEAARRASAKPSKNARLAKLSGALQDLAVSSPLNRAGRSGDQYVRVEILANSRRDARSLSRSLARLGFRQTGTTGISFAGSIPTRSLEALATLPTVRSAMALHYVLYGHGPNGGDRYVSPVIGEAPVRAARVGAVEGEAQFALRAAQARETYGVDGSGVCIGMLSDSYNNLGGAAAGMASGDLPEDILVIEDLDGGGSDEGRAMMELAYDVAPGADFAFHTAFGGFDSFSGGIIELFQAGCEVVVDDVGLAGGAMFQDGVIAQAADYVASQGGKYFSSAGNSSDGSYESDFQNSGEPGLFGGDLHDFDPGPGVDAFQAVTVPGGGGFASVLRFVLQYDEPSVFAGDEFTSFPDLIGGAEGQAPTSDYDVYVLDRPSVGEDAVVLDVSANFNSALGAPFEFIEFVNTGTEDITVYVAIEKFEGEDRRLKYINFGGNDDLISGAEYQVFGTSTTFGHPNAAGAFATGAAPWFNTDQLNGFVASRPETFGAAVVESFTSFGGLGIRLDIDGNRLPTPEFRLKPEATATDGDNNTFFGFDSGVDEDTNPNFFGTSAASPNTGGVAALIIEATGGVSTQALYDALKNTAADILPAPGFGANLGATPGFDNQSGFGLIRADAAIASLLDDIAVDLSPAAPVLFDLDQFDTDGDDPTFGEVVTIVNDGSVSVDFSNGTFAAFNPFTERITFAVSLSDVVAAGDSLVLANQNGDVDVPAGSIPDGPGAIVLLEGDAEVGDSVQDVLDSVVASVVYFDEDRIFGTRRGGADVAARRGTPGRSLLDDLAAVREGALSAASVDLTLTASPNPVRDRLEIAFGTADVAPVRASVYDALGRQVAVLADRSFEAGRHRLALDTAAMPSGVYVVRVLVGDDVQTKQVTVIR